MQSTDTDDDDKLDEDIFDTTKKLDTIDKPEELSPIPNFDPETFKKLTQQIQTMPKNERANLLENLSISFNNGSKQESLTKDQMFNHNFKTVTESSYENKRNLLKEKLRKLQMMRKSKVVRCNMIEEETAKQKEQLEQELQQNKMEKTNPSPTQIPNQESNDETPKKKKKKKKKKKQGKGEEQEKEQEKEQKKEQDEGQEERG